MLLIALSLRDGFFLPVKPGEVWYGISADTLDRGLRALTKEGLLRHSRIRK